MTRSVEKTSHSRYFGLDGLRAIAVMLVIVVHANLAVPGATGRDDLNLLSSKILGAGWIGVDLFFVLSGFLITDILLKTKGFQNYFQIFYARRALRIFPLYYLFLVAAVAAGNFFHAQFFTLTKLTALSLFTYTYNFKAAFANAAPHYHHFWSLAVEEHFYLIWPLLVFLLDAKRLRKLCFIGIIGSLILRIAIVESNLRLQTAYLISPCRIDTLLWGALLALDYRDQGWSVRRMQKTFAMAAAGLILTVCLQGHFFDFIDHAHGGGSATLTDSKWVLTLGIASLGPFFAAIVSAAANGSLPALEAKWLRAIGRYSYGIYVLHLLCLHIAIRFLRGFSLLKGGPMGSLLIGAVTLLLSFILAGISFRYLETPFLKLKDRFDFARQPLTGEAAEPQLTSRAGHT